MVKRLLAVVTVLSATSAGAVSCAELRHGFQSYMSADMRFSRTAYMTVDGQPQFSQVDQLTRRNGNISAKTISRKEGGGKMKFKNSFTADFPGCDALKAVGTNTFESRSKIDDLDKGTRVEIYVYDPKNRLLRLTEVKETGEVGFLVFKKQYQLSVKYSYED